MKDNDYNARFIFLAAPSVTELEQRLIKRGTDAPEKVKECLEIAKEELKQSEIEGFHDKIFVNDHVDVTYQKLEAYIFGDEVVDATESGVPATDTDMADQTTAVEKASTSAMEVEATEWILNEFSLGNLEVIVSACNINMALWHDTFFTLVGMKTYSIAWKLLVFMYPFQPQMSIENSTSYLVRVRKCENRSQVAARV